MAKFVYRRSWRTLTAGLWKDNPIFCAVLGICSTLAVTNRVENALAMSVGVVSVLILSSVVLSATRKFILPRTRIITYLLTIATLVIFFDRLLKAFFPIISANLGPYVGLIITNCIIMGRAEAFAVKNKVTYSFLDALGCGFGYAYILILISLIREVLAFGTILGLRIMPGFWTNWRVMAMAPGAFFVLAIYLWIFRSLVKVKPE